MKKSKRELFKICEIKIEKMKARRLIASGEMSYNSLTDEVNSWIRRRDGYSILIRDIVSPEDFIERAKRFCTKNLD